MIFHALHSYWPTASLTARYFFFLRNTECGAEVDGDVVWHGKVWHGKVAWEGVAGEGVAGEGVAWEVVTQEGFHLWCFVFRGMG